MSTRFHRAFSTSETLLCPPIPRLAGGGARVMHRDRPVAMRRALAGVALGLSLASAAALAQDAAEPVDEPTVEQLTEQAGDARVPADDGQPVTLEELEAYVAEQKEALDAVLENRTATEERAEEVEERLAEREARIEETRRELEDLCREREEVEPGTLEQCMAVLED